MFDGLLTADRLGSREATSSPNPAVRSCRDESMPCRRLDSELGVLRGVFSPPSWSSSGADSAGRMWISRRNDQRIRLLTVMTVASTSWPSLGRSPAGTSPGSRRASPGQCHRPHRHSRTLWRVAQRRSWVPWLVRAGWRGAGARGGRRCIVSGWGRVALAVVAVALVAACLEPGRVVLVPLAGLAGLAGGRTARPAGRRC